MDERQKGIVEGKGLQESRLNQDFLDFLRKWSSPVLFILAGLSLGWWLWTRHVESQAQRRGDAFRELDQLRTTANPSPDSLRGIANDYANVEGVPEQARLSAADEYLRAVRRGVLPGAELNADGTPQDEADLLTDEDRERFLGLARELYSEVEATTRGTGMVLLRLNALSGLAAVDESRANPDAARGHLNELVALAEQEGFTQLAGAAKDRIAALDSVAPAPRLYALADLPKEPEPELPIAPEPGTPTEGDLTIGPVPEGPTLDSPDPQSPAGSTEGDQPANGTTDAPPTDLDPDTSPNEPTTDSATEPPNGGG